MVGWVGGNIAAPQIETETYLSSRHIDSTISNLHSRCSSDIGSDADSLAPLLFRDGESIYSSYEYEAEPQRPPLRHAGRSSNSGPRNMASKRYLALTQVKCTGHSLMPGPQAPRLLITDETIVPVCVKLQDEQNEQNRRRRSMTSKLREQAFGRGRLDNLKVVQMPRGEYLRHFAKDSAGNYKGTEPYHTWTADELEQAYGQYRTLPVGTLGSAATSSNVYERDGGKTFVEHI